MDSVGKRLTKARLARGLSVEEVAHSTRIRPDKILALEDGDYSRFGGNAYAKGFLILYSRFLKVDVDDEARFLEAPRTISVSDYQYLSNNAHLSLKPERDTPSLRLGRQERPSAVPLVAIALLATVVIAAYYVVLQFQRLDPHSSSPAKPTTTAPANVSEPAPATPAATPNQNIQPPTKAATDEQLEAAPKPAAPTKAAAQNETGAAALQPPVPLQTPIPDASFLADSPASQPQAAPTKGIPSMVVSGEDIAIGVKRKTRVNVYRDDHSSRPIFSDFLYPGDSPLKLPRKGTRFFIETQDPSAVEVRRNGALFAFQPGASIP